MAIELASGYVSVSPNAKGFGSKLQAEIGPDLDSVGNDAGEKVGKGFVSRFQSSTTAKIGAALTAAFAGSKIVDGLSGAVSGASDLNETVSKVGVIFGESSGTVEDFAAGADKAFGQSRQQALDAAATFATFGKSAGLSGDQLAGFSTGLVGLSADFASFFNTSPAESIEAIGAALRGESEPIRKYGILLDDATLRNRALALGLIATTKEALTPQQKVLAAQAEIYAQSADAQGDFARTSEDAANKQRILSAQAKNASTELGQALLPAYAAIVSFLAEKVVPAITKVTTFLSEHKAVAIGVGIAIASILVVALLAWAAAAIAAAAATIAAAAPFLLIAAAVVGFIAVMIILPAIVGRNLDKILGFFVDVFGKIAEFFAGLPGMILSFIGDAASWLVDAGRNALLGFAAGVLAVWPQIVEFFTSLPGAILGFIGDLLGWLFNTGRDLLQGLINGYLSLIAVVASFFTSLPGEILGWIGNLIGLLFGTGGNVLQGFLNGLNSMLGAVAGFFAGLPGRILGWLGNLGGLLVGAGASVIQGLLNGINSAVGGVAGTVSSIPSIIRGAVGDLSGILFSAGRSIIQGLINGINSMLGPLRSALGAVTSLIPDWKGPPQRDAKILYESGRLVMGGFMSGIDSTLPALRSQLGSVTGMIGGGASVASLASATQAGGAADMGSPTIVINAPLGVDRTEVIASVQQGLRQYSNARGSTRGSY